GQLPGGGEHQGPDGPAGDLLPVQPLENGGGEGAGLARARLGAAQHVPPVQGGGDGLFLNGGRALIALLRQRLQDGRAEAELCKGHSILPFFSLPPPAPGGRGSYTCRAEAGKTRQSPPDCQRADCTWNSLC